MPFISEAASREDASQLSAANDEDGVRGVSGLSTSNFEFCEDPSFWKDHNVQVIIRIRPLSSSEISLQGYNRCVRQESCQTVTWIGHPESRFTFDLVADENVSQEKLFKVAGLSMVENCMGGYNSCMFAYGQTGSGKTHTMLGDIEGGTRRHSVNCGMTPRIFEYLFSRIQKDKEARRDEKLRFTCKCSFLEIYNEQILDLLEPSSNNLQIREDIRRGVYVENLKEIEVSSSRDVIQQLLQGAANRKVASTNMNHASSRSHSVFTCIIESQWESQGVTHHRFARLNLVDLAGSERQKSSGAEGERLKEATNINKSLSTLGLVIMNLVSISNGKSLHVPYRDSKLTFLLQDSLGGNAKTTIIANISPSSCCSLETLSTLKFAQRAKFIKNNAIVNEDASGDVIAMRLQIQQLKKEVSRLRDLVKGGTDNEDVDSSAMSLHGSPGSLRWEGINGLFSPLTACKRTSQKNDYEAALVGAFRREKDKDIALQASAAEIQAAQQLAKQRADEIQGLKMRLRFREAEIKRLEAVIARKLSPETHLLKEKEEHLKEIEVLRAQVDRNQEVTRFAMENLRLTEEIRRLKTFYEGGEREMMAEQISILENKLLEALDWKLMHESNLSTVQKSSSQAVAELRNDNLLISSRELLSPAHSVVNEENEFLRMQAIQNQAELDDLHKKLDYCLEEKEKLERRVNELLAELDEERSSGAMSRENKVELPALSSDGPNVNYTDQMELKRMVDAIAAASQREAEAHEKAISLSKENEELRTKLKVSIEDNSKLIELYEKAAAESNVQNKEKAENTKDCDKEVVVSDVHMVEMKKVVADLESQLLDMQEENEKLMGLYENAMQEKDELRRILSSFGQKGPETKVEFSGSEKLLLSTETREENEEHEKASLSLVDEVSVLENGISRLNMHDGDGFGDESTMVKPEETSPEENVVSLDTENRANQEQHPRMPMEDVNLVRMTLEKVDEQLSDSSKSVNAIGSLERTIFAADKLSKEIEAMEEEIQVKQQQLESLKTLLSEAEERRVLVQKKFAALKYSASSFASSVVYFEQRESRARARVQASKSYLDQKRIEWASLQGRKDEVESALKKIQESEVEVRNNVAGLKSKLEEENRKQENEKVLFAIDNVEKMDPAAPKKWHLGGKATELLKSEEEKTKLQIEMKLSREQLVVIRKELEDLAKKSGKLDREMLSLKAETEKASRTLVEMEFALQKVIEEKETLEKVREKGKSEIESLILEYQQSLFEAGLKEEELKSLEQELQSESRRMEELLSTRRAFQDKNKELLENQHDSCLLSEKLERELRMARLSVQEARSLLEH